MPPVCWVRASRHPPPVTRHVPSTVRRPRHCSSDGDMCSMHVPPDAGAVVAICANGCTGSNMRDVPPLTIGPWRDTLQAMVRLFQVTLCRVHISVRLVRECIWLAGIRQLAI